LVVTEEAGVMLQQTSKKRSAVLKIYPPLKKTMQLKAVTIRAVSAALHTPQKGGPRCHLGPKIPVPSPLSTPEKTSIPKSKYDALKISEVRGPFERKVHYSYFGPL